MAKYSAQASNIQSISGTANSVVKSGGVLKPGDSVFVRVLSSLGGQKYSVSFAGNRFSVTSHTNLTPGESFRAQVQFQSGTLLLVPEFSQNATSMGQTISIQNYLATLGLSNDMFSEQLIQLFVGMGIKFNNKRAQRIRTLSAHFPGREKEAAEIALILFEKGIEPDIDTVMQLLAVFYGKHKKNVHEKNIKEKEEGFDGCDSKKDPARILKKIYGAIEDVLSRKTGLLTLFNHIRGNKHHWLVFPINHEIPLKNTKKTIRGEGSVRILLDIEQKMAEKTIIMLRFSNKIYKFVLKCNSLEFCTIPDIIQKERKTSVDALSTIIGSNSLEVRYNSEISQQGFYNENAVIPFIQTEA